MLLLSHPFFIEDPEPVAFVLGSQHLLYSAIDDIVLTGFPSVLNSHCNEIVELHWDCMLRVSYKVGQLLPLKPLEFDREPGELNKALQWTFRLILLERYKCFVQDCGHWVVWNHLLDNTFLS